MLPKASAAVLMLAGATMAADVSSSGVTFNKDVLPILQKNCQSCHRPGQIAPMSFLSYKEARPWAKAMKAAVERHDADGVVAGQQSQDARAGLRGVPGSPEGRRQLVGEPRGEVLAKGHLHPPDALARLAQAQHPVQPQIRTLRVPSGFEPRAARLARGARAT